jgi:branched-chain amino acid transport system substrate-binding protein
MRARLLGLSILAGAVALTLVGCASSSEPAPTPTATPTPVPASGDGVLRIGDLTPLSGGLSATAAAQSAGVELAVKEINQAGGYNGHAVEVWHRNAGDGDAAATQASFLDLKAHGVDVVIAPASASVLAELTKVAAPANVAVLSIASKDNAPSGASVTPAKPDDAFVGRLKSADPSLGDTTYGVEAYDLTIAAALAATFVKDDGGASITQGMVGVTSGGIRCTSYGACLDVLKTQPVITYLGPAGAINFTPATGLVYFGAHAG